MASVVAVMLVAIALVGSNWQVISLGFVPRLKITEVLASGFPIQSFTATASGSKNASPPGMLVPVRDAV